MRISIPALLTLFAAASSALTIPETGLGKLVSRALHGRGNVLIPNPETGKGRCFENVPPAGEGFTIACGCGTQLNQADLDRVAQGLEQHEVEYSKNGTCLDPGTGMMQGHIVDDPSTVVAIIENENPTPVRDDAFIAHGADVREAFKQIEARCGKGVPGTIGQRVQASSLLSWPRRRLINAQMSIVRISCGLARHNAMANANQEPIRDDPAVLELLYQPLLLEDAMNKVMTGHRDGAGESFGIPTDSMLPSFEAYKCFANKLAQVLDCEPGGKTVTALTILKGRNMQPVYVIASNLRSQDQLEDAQRFLTKLLRFVHDNPLELNPKPLFKKVLGQILMFNLSRVQVYLTSLKRCLSSCIVDCGIRGGAQPILELEQELKTLQNKASFPMDPENDNEKNKFLSDCDTLLKAISINKGTRIEESILEHSDDMNKSSLEAWQELRHCLGRLHSYRQAAEVILAAHERWPQLFQEFRIYAILCGRKAPNPILNRQLSAETIVRTMLWYDEDPKPYLRQVGTLDKIGLSSEIRKLAQKKTFHPFVHAEVQVHAALIQQYIFRPCQFWNGYKYIGSSKPTCRLCSYYFFERGDGMQVRPTHHNIYLHWRLPDVYPSQGPAEVRTHRELLDRITEHVRKDARRTLDERLPSRRRHDSDDHSSIPSLLYPHFLDSTSSLSELASETSHLHISSPTASSVMPQSVGPVTLSQLVGEGEGDNGFDSDDDGEMIFVRG
ncbi:hypothetical protein PG997_007213 [Apiospora hydei]|uniref:Uncharacterized protein n=1 Tax=Apiospora hydei TaxID=1337664 RepID=A0ABR1W7C5_9PEZI